MPLYTAGQFLETCEAQSVELNKELEEVLVICSGDETPRVPLFLALDEMGHVLQKKESKPLSADKTIRPTRAMIGDTCAKSLCRIVNTSVNPIAETKTPVFESGEPGYVHACRDAEGRFIRTIASIGRFLNGKQIENGAQIIINGTEPLIIRKDFGEESGLTLSPTIIDGIEYPAGSIVALSVNYEELDYGDSRPPRDKIDLVDHKRVGGISFVRFSRLGLRPEERIELSSNYDDHFSGYTPKEARIYRSTTIQTIYEVATKAVAKLTN
jgi:hypothetical protein